MTHVRPRGQSHPRNVASTPERLCRYRLPIEPADLAAVPMPFDAQGPDSASKGIGQQAQVVRNVCSASRTRARRVGLPSQPSDTDRVLIRRTRSSKELLDAEPKVSVAPEDRTNNRRRAVVR